MPGGTVGYQTLASNISGGTDETTYYSISIDPSSLTNGENLIAVEVHQSSRTSSDLSFDLELSGVVFTTPNPLYLKTVGSNLLRARVKNNNEWSALTEADFVVDAEPVSADNISISEIHYRPSAPNDEEIDAGYNERSDFEFIELLNISSRAVDFGSVQFTKGVQFDFSLHDSARTLLPGERGIIVNNYSAFNMRYGMQIDPGLKILGEFLGNLNNDGEQLVVSDQEGNSIIDITFNDGKEWPEGADGLGYSLIKINPVQNVSDNTPATWRSSSDIGGNPGSTDETNFQRWSIENLVSDPFSDSDHDGMSTLTEYAIGGDPNMVSSNTGITIRLEILDRDDAIDEYLIIDMTRRIGADDVVFKIQMAQSLNQWSDLIFPKSVIKSINNGNGTETVSYIVGKVNEIGDGMYFRKVVSLK